MNFGDALVRLKAGHRVARTGWNGRGMWLGLVRGGEMPQWTFTNGLWDNFPLGSFVAMKTADGTLVPWLASQTDVLAEDWVDVTSSPT